MTSGWIILDKPTGVFSRTAGARVARLFDMKKFGHIGTLDPMASGVLPIAIGNATKMIPFVEDTTPDAKEYDFSMQFGFETDTLDVTGTETGRDDFIPSNDAVLATLPELTGDICQVPPLFSAVHIDGVRAYELGRRRVTGVAVPSRHVRIDALELTGGSGDTWNFHVRCGRGTYVRSIARDIAAKCGAMATVNMIRRTYANGFSIKNAIKLDFLENLVNNGVDPREFLGGVDFGLGDIPVWNLDDSSAEFFKNGGFVDVAQPDGRVRVYCNDKFIGMGAVVDGQLRPKRII